MMGREAAAGTMPITQHSHSPEITPEMIEAGIEALKREPLLDCSYDQAWNLAEDVIRRALAASRKGTYSTAS